MPTSYTSLLGLALPVTGDLAGTWGSTVNDYITQYLDASVAGAQTISGSQTAVTLTLANGVSLVQAGSTGAGSSQFNIINCTGNPASMLTVTAPAASKTYVVVNATSTSQDVKIVGAGPTTGVTLVSGEKALIAWNGSDFIKVVTSVVGDVVGPASATDTAIALFNTATGKLLKNSLVTVSAAGAVVAPQAGSTIPFYFANQAAFPSASTYHGALAHSHADGAMYFAHGGSWVKMLDAGTAVTVAQGGTGLTSTPANGALDIGNGSGFTRTTLTAGSNITVTNGAGSITIAATGGSPGGSTTQVQYNNAGAFAGSANFTFDGTNIAVASRTFGRGAATSGGANNVAAGQNALSSNTTGEFSIAMGYNALTAQTTGSSNTGLGNAALAAVVSGNNNTGVGRNAFTSTTASDNTGVGYFAGLNTTTGAYNTAVGAYALSLNTTANDNTAVGYSAAYSNTTGTSNTAIGFRALYTNSTSNNNTAIGYQAGYFTTGARNLFIGSQTGFTNTTGTGNTFVSGWDANNWPAGYYNTTGADNSAFGGGALRANTTGSYNTAIGTDALHLSTTAEYNTAVGYQALTSNTTGTFHVAVGRGALAANTTASYGTAVGHNALNSATGDENTALGYGTGRQLTTGIRNTFLGGGAGDGGYGALPFTTGSNNVSIGVNSGASAGGVTNSIVIATAIAVVDKGTNTGFITPNGGGVYQGNNSANWSTTSDLRLKKNIVDNNEGLEKISAIRVRNFEYRLPEEVDPALKPSDAVKKTGVQLGVIAQELQQVCPDCVKEESTGVLSVDSDNVFWHMVNAIKQLKSELDTVKAELATLKGN